MIHRFLTSKGVAAAVVAIALLAPGSAVGQARKSYKPPRTRDGQPDFQGIWATATLTPLERPADLAGKEFLTPQEAAEYERRTLDRVNTDHRGASSESDLNGHYNEFWRDRATSVISSRRTSLIVDPPDGRMPALTPQAQKRRADMLAAERSRSGPEDLPLRLRCVTRGLPMLPTPNNNFLQIVQGPEHFVILQEMMYEARIIPLSTKPHAPQFLRGYMGDARGHWEGDALVIDTTNFSHQHEFMGSNEGLHIVERLTRISPGEILYEFTVDDPDTFSKPWSAELPMRKSQEGLFDFECHEGNYSMVNILGGARLEEKKAAEEAGKHGTK